MGALAASARQEIVDVLPRMGVVSVAELAVTLGRPADSLYYHLRILKRVGLVLSAGYRMIAGRREALFQAVAADMKLHYELGKNGNGKEVNAIVASMLRLGMRDFNRSVEAGEAAVSGPNRELWALRETGWLSQEQIGEVNRYIVKLMRAAARTGPDGRLYGVTVLLTPLDRPSNRHEEDE